jgi:hypothetical protein
MNDEKSDLKPFVLRARSMVSQGHTEDAIGEYMVATAGLARLIALTQQRSAPPQIHPRALRDVRKKSP